MGASEASVCMLSAQPTNPGGLQEEEADRNLLGTCLEFLSPIKLVCCLLITVIVALSVALSVRNPEKIIERLVYASCPRNWIGFGSKCFYFSEERRNWTHGHASCVAFEAQLAQFDSLEELKFLRRYAKSYDYWIGLCGQLSGQTWNWMNSTEYNNLVPIRGEGECAFLNENGISSSRDYIERKWICSKPNSYIIQCPTELSSGHPDSGQTRSHDFNERNSPTCQALWDSMSTFLKEQLETQIITVMTVVFQHSLRLYLPSTMVVWTLLPLVSVGELNLSVILKKSHPITVE